MHCVTTPEYNMDDHNVAIGKEFELTVADSLEFILTLKASYEKPRGTLVEVTEKKVVKSRNRLSRLFGLKDIITTTKFVPTEVKDTWLISLLLMVHLLDVTLIYNNLKTKSPVKHHSLISIVLMNGKL